MIAKYTVIYEGKYFQNDSKGVNYYNCNDFLTCFWISETKLGSILFDNETNKAYVNYEWI